MATLLLALGVGLVGWAATVWWLWERTRLPALRRRVLVNCDDDTAVRGVLIETRGAWLILRQAELLRPEGTPATLDGETYLLRSRVLFLQVLP